MSLMPVLIHHFDQPTEFCIKVVSNIQQVSLYTIPITCSIHVHVCVVYSYMYAYHFDKNYRLYLYLYVYCYFTNHV